MRYAQQASKLLVRLRIAGVQLEVSTFKFGGIIPGSLLEREITTENLGGNMLNGAVIVPHPLRHGKR